VRSESVSIVVALALHVGVFAVARAMPPLSSLLQRDRRELDTIEIVELPPSKPVAVIQDAPRPEAPRPLDPVEPRPDAHVAPRIAPEPTGPQAPTTAEPVNPPPPSATEKPTQWDHPPEDRPPGVLGVPGLGGPAAWAMPGVLPGATGPAPPAPTVAPAARPIDRHVATRILNEELAKKDKKLGLDLPVAGSMSSAVRTAVQGSELPAGVQASIQCRVSPNGAVTGCRLVGSNGGGAAAWAQAVRAAGSVAGAALRGRYASGAVVTISVSISNTSPSGSKGGLQGAGANFDLSNIGAHTTRLVRTSHSVAAAQ
jgi:hypothetical protein